MKRIKKIILPLLIILLTGCRAEYNLTIDGDNYIEKVSIIGENSNEINNLNDTWYVPIDRNDYAVGSDDAETLLTDIKTYDYRFSASTLTFSHNFSKGNIPISTAISNCYNNITVTTYEDTTIISTSSNALCFSKYPDLSSVTINITVDKKVISNNADIVDNNTYIWRLNRNNASNKSIDMVIDDTTKVDESTSILGSSNNNNNNNNDLVLLDTDMYIFAAILLVVLLLGYAIVSNIKKQDDNMDD